jgi:predicted RNase H-like HicB family nuclease
MRKFTLEYWEDEGWYVGRIREIPSVMSQGESLEDLEANIRDAYQLMSEAAPVPVASFATREIEV